MPPKKKRTATKSKIKKGKKVGLGLLTLILMGLFILGDLLYMAKQWATPPAKINVQAVLTVTAEDVPGGTFKAWDAAASANGFYLSDQPNNRILIFDRKGKYIDSITNKDAGKPDFKELSCMTLAPNGDLFCMDTWNTLVRGFTPKKKPLPVVNISNKGFFGPRGVAYSNGYFLVADTGSQRIAKVSPDGDVLASWGKHGSGKLEFDNPYQVVADDQGRIYVADRDNHRIQCLDANGKYLWEASTYYPPMAEAVDNTDRLLYVSNDQSVRAYDMTGKLVGVLAAIPNTEDAFTHIGALSVFPDGDILVCRGNNATIYHPLPHPTAK